MEMIFKIIAVGLIATIAIMIVKPIKSDFALLIGVVSGIIIILFVINYVSGIFLTLKMIVSETGVNSSLFSLILKIVGVGYLAEFTAGICSDAGVAGLGDKVLLGAKIVILTMALPILNNIFDIVLELLPS